jgi:hypothetical protein
MRTILEALESIMREDAELAAMLQPTAEMPTKVFPFMPTSEASYPCITYYLNTGNPHAEIDAEEIQTYSIDLWVLDDYGLLQDIFARLRVLFQNGIQPESRTVYSMDCEFYQDLSQESGSGVLYHKVTRWELKSIE